MKLVSVIIPTYGGGDYLQTTINSVIEQDYPHIEIIVVDDNGKGTPAQRKTQRKLKQFMTMRNFKYMIHESNKNASAARNTGARESQGFYLNFIDDDDSFSPEKISRQVENLDQLEEDWGASYCSRITKFQGKVHRIVKAKKSGNILYDYLMHRIQIGTGSLLLRKSVWESCNGYDESFRRHQDWEFIARVADKFKLIATPEAYFVRNYLGRNTPQTLEEHEKIRGHYIQIVNTRIFSLSATQKKRVIMNDYISIALKYLHHGQFKNFYRIFNDHVEGICGVYLLSMQILDYVKKRILGIRYT